MRLDCGVQCCRGGRTRHADVKGGGWGGSAAQMRRWGSSHATPRMGAAVSTLDLWLEPARFRCHSQCRRSTARSADVLPLRCMRTSAKTGLLHCHSTHAVGVPIHIGWVPIPYFRCIRCQARPRTRPPSSAQNSAVRGQDSVVHGQDLSARTRPGLGRRTPGVGLE